MSKKAGKEKVGDEKQEQKNVTECVTEKWVVETTPDKLSELIKYATHNLDMDCFINDKNEITFSTKGTSVEKKEILYICTIPIEETADYICSLPYTLVESIIEFALKDEDFAFDILSARITLLRYKYLNNGNTKKALRKLLRICQVLGCIGYFDFGDWEEFRNEENHSVAFTAYEILFINYPAFREHFSKLKDAGIIEETENGLKWKRKKIAIAEYFAYLECKEQRQRWVVVEKIFKQKNLCQHLRTHKERQSGKPSIDFDEIKKLLELD